MSGKRGVVYLGPRAHGFHAGQAPALRYTDFASKIVLDPRGWPRHGRVNAR